MEHLLDQEICRRLEHGEALVLATILEQAGSTPRLAGARMLVCRSGAIYGTIGGGLVEARAREQAREVFASGKGSVLGFDLTGEVGQSLDMICGGSLQVQLEYIPATAEQLAIFRQRVAESQRQRATCLIYGAGHVSRQVAVLTVMVGFRTVVFDDRQEFANRERFADADEVIVLPDFAQAFAAIPVSDNSYVVIVTRGHLHDQVVLAQALRSKAGYVGMIGSRRKRDAIYQALREQGFQERDLQRVHCPIGLAIEAETPEEIAVSIVAELIAVRAGRAK